MVEAGMEISPSIDPCTPFSARTSIALPASSASNAAPNCDLVTVPARQGLEAVDILRRGAGDAVGPVLHDDGCDTLGFLVPPGTAAAWDVPGSTCTETNGRGLSLAVPDPAPPVEGSDWLLPPGDADLATDPAVLRAALGEAARLIEAADNRR
ncbi:hypothetical protein ACKI1I_38760 [Streptomyces turgidiscabies]|uniref:Uncharacterized protein n=1 Tax=Streptomyces turgidiscabies (strain Car8) TaxID=698760 RepID=L7F7L0_STRT8|nr:hypothetical protein [Streptomyces turgidiscabies]ELP67237.1 hypothetical protein STRTUCAR8_04232 [Streptomyces turgidiscabies Car8]MDX3496059.1 hypothetical protein [Streptomyces turgidiscabies]